MSLVKGTPEAFTIFLKNEYRGISLTSEQRTMVAQTRNSQAALTAVAKYFGKEFHTGGNKAENATRLRMAGYVLDEDIVRHTIQAKLRHWIFRLLA